MTATGGAAELGGFGVTSEETADRTVISVRGEVDVSTSPQLRDEIYRAVDGGARKVVLDLSEMDFIDSSGLGVFVGALKRAREHSGEIELRSLQPAARKVFDITGLSDVFSIGG